MTQTKTKVDTVLGAQWGDEGKGKIVDYLCQKKQLCCRSQGGNNAGHSVFVNGKSYKFHLLPSGLINPECHVLLGHGMVINLTALLEEIKAIEKHGLMVRDRIHISDRAHLVFDVHIQVDELKELELGKQSLGTTKRGIGPAYSNKYSRSGIRVHELMKIELNNEFRIRYQRLLESRAKRYGDKIVFDIEVEMKKLIDLKNEFSPMVLDGVNYLHQALNKNKHILIEGANALMLDIDLGTYPYVTSSNTSIGGVLTGLGIPPTTIGSIIGVVKAYLTRVGEGPFLTELKDDVGAHLAFIGKEFGTTTARPRRCGWLDLPMLFYSLKINGYSLINLTKLDVLSGLSTIRVCVAYEVNGEKLDYYPSNFSLLANASPIYQDFPGWFEDISMCNSFDDLPSNAKNYVLWLEQKLDVPIKWIGIGPNRSHLLERH